MIALCQIDEAGRSGKTPHACSRDDVRVAPCPREKTRCRHQEQQHFHSVADDSPLGNWDGRWKAGGMSDYGMRG
jgi:hypothetical protein